MALEIISGSVYHGSSSVQKPEYKSSDMNVQNIGSMINVTEILSTSKTTNSGQDEQGRSQQGNKNTEKQIKNAISRANSQLKNHRTRCEFSYDEETKRVSIKVLDEETKEVIKEIPPEETLEMIEKMWELAGLLVDERR